MRFYSKKITKPDYWKISTPRSKIKKD